MTPVNLNPHLTIHLMLRRGIVLCQSTKPERHSTDSLHNVNCAKCLTIATTIVHAARSGKRGSNG